MKLGSTIAAMLVLAALLAGGAVSAAPSPVLARIAVGAEAWTIAAGPDGSVWSDGAKGALRIDPATDRISVRTTFRGPVNASAGSIWVPTGRALRRLHPATGAVRAKFQLPLPGESVVATAGAAWVTSPENGLLLRVDLRTRGVTKIRTCEAKWQGLAVAAGSVWSACWDGRLLRIDAKTRRVVARIRLAYGVHSLTTGAGSVWVNNHASGELVRIDPATNRVVARISTSRNSGLTFALGRVWAASGEGVFAIDPRANRIVGVLPVGIGEFYGLAYARGSLWVTTTNQQRVVRIDPSRLRPAG